jgi:hypothetical protein
MRPLQLLHSTLSASLWNNHAELFLLAFWGFPDSLLCKSVLFVHVWALPRSSRTSSAAYSTTIRLLSTILLLFSRPSTSLVLFLALLNCFAQSVKLSDRPLVEKAFLAFMVADGITNPPEFPVYGNFLTSFLLYCLSGAFFLENSFKRFLATNAVFVGTITYFFVAYWPFITYLVKVKLGLLLWVSAKIVFGVLLINLAKRLIKTQNVVVRKYFHFLAFYLFVSLMTEEVSSSA